MRNGSGPYAYRVYGSSHPDAYPDQYWEYLGPVGRVDPAELSDEETAELREEGFALARYRDGDSAELHMRDVANSVRDELTERWGDAILAPTDDKRETVVQLSESAPPAAERVLDDNAAEMQGELAQQYGQSPLTEAERDRIDWSEPGQNIPHARAAKAAITGQGVEDWSALYSGDIESDGWDDVVERNRESMGGDRMDEGDRSDRQAGADAVKVRSQLEDRALEGAAEGYDEARAALREDHGWTDEEIDATIEEREDL